MKNPALYDARCAIIDQFGEDVANIPHRPALRRALTTVLLIWQRWTSEDFHAHDERITLDWTGPLDLLADDRELDATMAHVVMSYGAAEALTKLDTKALKTPRAEERILSPRPSDHTMRRIIMSKAAFHRALKGATHVHVTNERYPELSGLRELVKVQTNAMASRLPVDHPRYDEVKDGSWTYFDKSGYMAGETYTHVDPNADNAVIARFTPATGSGECMHCGRTVLLVSGVWMDPNATGDDSVWMETCDAHDTFTAEHEVAL